MDTRSISTSVDVGSCDVCGRTLLRGERAEMYVGGGGRHSVCSLCSSRAVHEGWVREGTDPGYNGSAGIDRRRSLLSRLWARLEPAATGSAAVGPPALPTAPVAEMPAPAPPPVQVEPPLPQPSREPRHVRAVPSSIEHKMSSAVELFNGSEHPRTVAGISRSFGIPEVSVLPSAKQASMVNVVVAWELCWYRYEIDLSDEVPSVRVAAQGTELDELAPEERHLNAVADDRGVLSL